MRDAANFRFIGNESQLRGLGRGYIVSRAPFLGPLHHFLGKCSVRDKQQNSGERNAINKTNRKQNFYQPQHPKRATKYNTIRATKKGFQNGRSSEWESMIDESACY